MTVRILSLLSLTVSILLGIGCSNGVPPAQTEKDIAEALVGHWQSDSDDHHYYAPIDSSTKRGQFVMIQGSRPERPSRHEYEVIDYDNHQMTLRIHFESGGAEDRKYSFDQAGDTLNVESFTTSSGTPIIVRYGRVGDQTSPDPK